MRKVVVIALAVAAVGGGFFWTTRCRVEPLPLGHTARICHRLFRPTVMLVFDEDGRLFEYSLLESLPTRGSTPKDSYVDLFDSGRISESVTNHVDGVAGHQRVEISTADDGKVDLLFEYAKVAHPVGGELRKVLRVDRSKCLTWTVSQTQIEGHRLVTSRCADPAAFTPISASQALELVESLPIRRDREGLVLGRFHQDYAPKAPAGPGS